MALLFSISCPSPFLDPSINPNKPLYSSLSVKPNSLGFSLVRHQKPVRFSRVRSSESDSEPENAYVITDEWGERSDPETESDAEPDAGNIPEFTDEWGERSEPDPDEPATSLADSDPPRYEDEWEEERGGDGEVGNGNGSAVYDRAWELKRILADTVYGTELGFRAESEVRGEVLELLNQLEALNPTPTPVEASDLLDGNWVLLYTAFSELLPLLAAGSTPFLKVKRITQSIDTKNLSVENSITLSGPLADFSFSASATFEVRSPSRIQVSFKEGTLRPPEIKSSLDLPENVELFGQQVNLSLLKQSLNPLQEIAANISRAISGQQPLSLPFPGNRGSSWLLITYLDKDLRISRGDGGIFVLAREGSSLLEL
ncbi:PREDICTED: plastid lipid-associated protein 3, chloroplastic-like [Tarenaya hassleriana]|uniref:plastid lipid-associated protein 3, chloroplastic-like n=1 Tax=Tarenaya hassleriana TaxID=28532 RepID=UPI00053C3165|nr:PREDICTED: plastid lipid-associated protein 3, chloroplastic-like [Tarenaya hassleriana]